MVMTTMMMMMMDIFIFKSQVFSWNFCCWRLPLSLWWWVVLVIIKIIDIVNFQWWTIYISMCTYMQLHLYNQHKSHQRYPTNDLQGSTINHISGMTIMKKSWKTPGEHTARTNDQWHPINHENHNYHGRPPGEHTARTPVPSTLHVLEMNSSELK